MKTPHRKLLSPEDWIMAGLKALAMDGHNAVRAEPLARRLQTTKGSFYWHFADVADFRDKILIYWETHAYTDIIEDVETEPDSRKRLEKLCIKALGLRDPQLYGGAALEPAFRAWGRQDKIVAAAVARMDTRRTAYLTQLCRVAAITEPAIPRLLYAIVIGLQSLGSMDFEDNAQGISALLSGLFRD